MFISCTIWRRRSMRKTGAVAIAAMALMPVTMAQAAPQLNGGTSRECRETLSVAKVAFYSNSFYLNNAVALPPHMPVEIIGQSKEGDISGGDGVASDDTVFKKIDNIKSPTAAYLYWQIVPGKTQRWVISGEPFGWHGDQYRLYAIDNKINEVDFVSKEASDGKHVVVSDKWIPPLLLRDARTRTVWAVDTGFFEGVLGDWPVYVLEDSGAKQACTVVFSRKVKEASKLLPATVRTLALLLDGTLGDGRDEGTLHPTNRLRGVVESAWANVALRPWAMTTRPYNNRRDADLALRHWSNHSASFRALYHKIEVQYPLARASLTDYYVEKFGKTRDQAKALAARNLDIAYRSHFVFPQSAIHPALPVTPKPAE